MRKLLGGLCLAPLVLAWLSFYAYMWWSGWKIVAAIHAAMALAFIGAWLLAEGR